MSYDSEVTADSPTGRWKLDDVSGSTVVATTGSNGTYTNTPTLGLAGLITDGGTSVFTDDGSSEFFTVPISIASSAAFTIEFWIKWTTGTVPVRDNTTTNGTFPLFYSSSTVLQYRIAATTITVSGIDPDDVRNGSLFQVVLTRAAGASPTGRLYLNGVQAQSGTVGTGALTSPLTLGRNGSNSGQHSDATFDDVSVYSSELSSGRILAHYNAGIASSVRFMGIV